MHPPSNAVEPLLDGRGIAALRAALQRADFTVDGVTARLGAPAAQALARSDRTAALRATRAAEDGSGDPIAALLRLFILGVPVSLEAADSALWPQPLASRLIAGGRGDLPLGQVLALLAAAVDIAADVLSAAAMPVVRDLVGCGLLLPAGHEPAGIDG